MRTFAALVKKEVTGRWRTGTILTLSAVSFVFGIMNPLIAKLTPWLLEAMADSLAESGLTVSSVSVDALISWTQFFKNAPMALLVFVLMESTAFAKEYADGTLTLVLTKGVPRQTVVLAKSFVLSVEWTLGYWLHLGVTLLYTEIYWDNAVAQNLGISTLYWWLFGVFVTALLVLFSCAGDTSAFALLGTGGAVAICYLLSLFPKTKPYSPVLLTGGTALVYGTRDPGDFTQAAVVAAVATAVCFAAAIGIFKNKKL